jgi:hypothetical protein
MHKVSDHSAQLAVQHALLAIKHGKLIAGLGQRLQKHDDQAARQHGHYLEACGHIVQQYAQESLSYARSLTEGQNSIAVYTLAVEAHAKAAKVYNKAIQECSSRAVEERIKRWNKNSVKYPT